MASCWKTSALFFTLLTNMISIADQASSICWDVMRHKNCKLLPQDDMCGPVRSHVTFGTNGLSPRVLGGHDASPGEFPWIALLFYNNVGTPPKIDYECGGSIISARYVVTAAHCLDAGKSLAYVRVGEHDLKKSEYFTEIGVCPPHIQNIGIEFYVKHEYYNEEENNDIGLIRLKHSITFNDFVSPICLPLATMFFNNSFQNEHLQVAGWGLDKKEVGCNGYPCILKAMTLPVVPLKQCRKYFSSITNNQLCAGGVVGKDSCDGDSGGPLMSLYSVSQQPTRYFLIGVVSFGTTQCGIGSPGVYTKVPEFVDWILDNMDY